MPCLRNPVPAVPPSTRPDPHREVPREGTMRATTLQREVNQNRGTAGDACHPKFTGTTIAARGLSAQKPSVETCRSAPLGRRRLGPQTTASPMGGPAEVLLRIRILLGILFVIAV